MGDGCVRVRLVRMDGVRVKVVHMDGCVRVRLVHGGRLCDSQACA